MENMENVVLTKMTEIPTEVDNSGLGKMIGTGLLIVAGVALAVKGAIWGGKKIKNVIISKKTEKDDVVVEEFEEVTNEEA